MNMDYVTQTDPVRRLNCRQPVFYIALAFRAVGICFADNRLSEKQAFAMQLNFQKTAGVCAHRLWNLLILHFEFPWWQFLLALSNTIYIQPVLLRLVCCVCVWHDSVMTWQRHNTIVGLLISQELLPKELFKTETLVPLTSRLINARFVF